MITYHGLKVRSFIITLRYFPRYYYKSYTDDLTKAVQRTEIEKSLREWSEVADVSFVEVPTSTIVFTSTPVSSPA